MDKDLINYFISQTNKRFDSIEKKIDTILKFKWQIVGGSIAAGFFVTLLMNVIIFIVKR